MIDGFKTDAKKKEYAGHDNKINDTTLVINTTNREAERFKNYGHQQININELSEEVRQVNGQQLV